jgi:RNA polymerase sigma-54 factor
MMKAGLVQQQTTKLALTNELRQAIELLQYTSYELTTYINELSLENPFIQLKEPAYTSKANRTKSSYKQVEFEVASPTMPTLAQYVKSQIELQYIEQDFKNRILFLVASMDDDGYIREELDELCEIAPYTLDELKEALNYIQQHLEPIGIGAQCLRQSLLIQLQRKYPTSIITHKIVKHYFTSLAEKKWELISKELTISIADIKKSFELIRTLNPRPGSEFKKVETSYIVPDLFVEKRQGHYQVFTNERSYVSFSIDKDYLSFKNQYTDKESSNYLREKYQQANWVKQSIEQRKRTMVKVMEAILDKQEQFFEHGVSLLQPLTLKEIANEVDLHESTISRTVRGKYVQAPSGVFELKYFFHSKVKTTSDQDISSVRVKEIIALIVSKEDKQKPLSDQKISIQLKEDHKLKVSRRTVTKYREQLQIPSSSSRKQY